MAQRLTTIVEEASSVVEQTQIPEEEKEAKASMLSFLEELKNTVKKDGLQNLQGVQLDLALELVHAKFHTMQTSFCFNNEKEKDKENFISAFETQFLMSQLIEMRRKHQ
jgi:hypothetical protein